MLLTPYSACNHTCTTMLTLSTTYWTALALPLLSLQPHLHHHANSLNNNKLYCFGTALALFPPFLPLQHVLTLQTVLLAR
jgi:hypothetical protein